MVWNGLDAILFDDFGNCQGAGGAGVLTVHNRKKSKSDGGTTAGVMVRAPCSVVLVCW